jgi:DNA polymerase I-like protein with 3'-5' exonuclease and polymerase domains
MPKLITLDFETYYAADYSLRLKRYNTSGYIRDPQFQVHGVGIKIDGGKTKWYAGHAAAKKAIDAINWTDAALLAHNTAFDGAILAWHFGHIAAFYYDTLSMTRGLHNEVSRASLKTIAALYQLGEKNVEALENTKGKKTLTAAEAAALGAYCVQDTDLCHAIFQKQRAVFPQTELALIDLTLRMFIQPVFQINLVVAEKALAEELEERNWMICASGVPEKSLTSNPKFAAELEKLGVDCPMKISGTTGKETYALAQTDEGFIELLEHDDRRVVRLAAGRLAAKSTLFETRGRRLIDDGTGGRRLPVLLNYFGAKTGRWSGGNKTNMQNLPRLERTDAGAIIERGTGMLRLSLEAPSGHRICVADSAQIEARTLAWLAGQSDIVELFAKGQDVYCHMASIIYGRTITKKDKLERFIGKIAVLGLGYGMGANKFQTTLSIGIMGPPVELSLAVCKGIVNKFRAANNKITNFWKVAERILTDMVQGKTGSYEVDGHTILEWEDETVWLPNGMGLHYPELRWNNGFSYEANDIRKKIYGGLLVENIIQALARILVSDQMLDVAEYLKKFRLKKGEVAQVALMTHDEIVSVTPERFAEKATQEVIKRMRKRPEWAQGVPLDAEGGFAVRYEK